MASFIRSVKQTMVKEAIFIYVSSVKVCVEQIPCSRK